MSENEYGKRATSWLVAWKYLDRIRYLENAIKVNNQAIERHRLNTGLKGQQITEKTTGTKSTDRLECTAIESMEVLERLTADNELFKADLAAEIKPLELLSNNDRDLIRKHFIDYPDPTRTPKTKAIKGRVWYTPTDIDQVMAPYESLERLYKVLPESWKDCLPKAL